MELARAVDVRDDESLGPTLSVGKVMVLARAVDVRDKWDQKRRLQRNDA